jgi:hypothetical protein
VGQLVAVINILQTEWRDLKNLATLFFKVSITGVEKPACSFLYLWAVFNLASLDLYSFSCRSLIVLSVPTEPTVGAWKG